LYVLVCAFGVSVAGTAMSALAIPWLVLSETGSVGLTGMVGFAEMAPYVVVQVLSGPLADRIGPKRCCVWGNAIAAVLVCAIPGLSALGKLHFAVLVGLVALAGAVRGMADTATAPLIPATARLGAIRLERAAGLYSGANQTGRLVGAPLAGAVIAVTSAPAAVLVDGLTFAAAAAAIAALVPAATHTEPIDERSHTAGYLASLGEGLRFIGADRLLLSLVVVVATANMLGQALQSVFVPAWVRDTLHDPASLGLLGGAMNAGALAGVFAAAWLGPRLPRRVTFSVGYLLGGAPPFLALATLHTLPPVLVITAVSGVAGGVLNPIIGAVQYERIPAKLQARVLGAVKASAWTGLPIGSLLGGTLAAHTGLTLALLSTGSLMLFVTLAPSVLPTWRQLNTPRNTGSRRIPHHDRPGIWTRQQTTDNRHSSP
jgi:MFS family permease